MQTPTLMENVQESSANVQSRINQLEETIAQLYRSFCPLYGTIDFTQMAPEEFDSPYSIHSMSIPHTKLSVTLITNPPKLVIGTPSTHTPGPLHWEHELKIELPAQTMFVSVGYGGETGEVHWFSEDGTAHSLPVLPTPTTPDQARQFYLAQPEGIRGIRITSTGKMFLNSLTVAISVHAQSR